MPEPLPPDRCAVLVPVAGTIDPETDAALHVLANRGYAVRTLTGCSQVDLARSSLATEALAAGYDETFWIDSDVVFDPDDVDRLRGHGLPLVAGLYVKKSKGAGFAGKFKDGTREVDFGTGGNVIEVQYAGNGFLYVHSSVYRKIKADLQLPDTVGGYDPNRPITPYFIPSLASDGAGSWCYLSEDYSFQHRARNAGFAIMADTRVKLGHAGRHAYTWDDLVPRDRVDELKIRFDVAEPSPPVADPATVADTLRVLREQNQGAAVAPCCEAGVATSGRE